MSGSIFINFVDPTGRGAVQGNPSTTVNPLGPVIPANASLAEIDLLLESGITSDMTIGQIMSNPSTAAAFMQMYGLPAQSADALRDQKFIDITTSVGLERAVGMVDVSHLSTVISRLSISGAGLTDDVGRLLLSGSDNASSATGAGQPLFRGTTDGYTGNPVLQELGITPTTTNPAKAVIFAMDAAEHGDSVVHIFGRGSVDDITRAPANYFDAAESAVNLNITPASLASRADLTVPLGDAQDILNRLGVDATLPPPGTIMTDHLSQMPNMTIDQINAFIEAAEQSQRVAP